MTFHSTLSRRGLLGGAVLGAGVALTACHPQRRTKVRYGITPYQDSGLPVVAQMKGWYAADGLDVQLVPVTWDQVIPALSSGAIDCAIYNFNSFIAPYANAAQRTPKPLFYAPLFVFKGQAIMVSGAKNYRTVASSGASPTSLAAIGRQLKGKRIAVTQGTELEQIVLATLAAAGLGEKDATLVHSSPEDALAAFLSGNIDAFAAGLTERIAARRKGAVELVTQADVLSPVTDGLITTDRFAAENAPVLDKLVQNWFRTIRYIERDIPKNSAEIRDYLRTSASTIFSPEEYAIAWTFDVFAKSAAQAIEMFDAPSSPYNWKTSWDGVNKFLIDQKKISAAVPDAAYIGAQVMKRLSTEPEKVT